MLRKLRRRRLPLRRLPERPPESPAERRANFIRELLRLIRFIFFGWLFSS